MKYIYLDLSIAGLVILSTILGLYRGFIWELLKYIAFIIAGFCTYFIIQSFMHHFEHMEHFLTWISSISIALFTIISGGLFFGLSKIIKIIHKTHFSIYDRVLGGLFGGIKTTFFLSLLYTINQIITQDHKPTWITQSNFYALLETSKMIMISQMIKLDNKKMNNFLKLKTFKL